MKKKKKKKDQQKRWDVEEGEGLVHPGPHSMAPPPSKMSTLGQKKLKGALSYYPKIETLNLQPKKEMIKKHTFQSSCFQ